MRGCGILLLVAVCLSDTESRHPKTLPPNKHLPASGTQLDLIENLKRDMQTIWEQWQLHKNQMTELTEKYDVIREENDVLKNDNARLQTQITRLELRHNERLMRLEVTPGDLGTSNDDEQTLDRARDRNLFTNITRRNNQGQSVGMIVFQARNQGFTGASGTQIPFELVDINIGDSFDPSGLFTSPVAGIYQMNYEVLSDSLCDASNVCVRLYVNGVSIMLSCSEHAAGGGSSIILQLMAQDAVWLALSGACYVLHENTGSEGSSQFGGYLLHETI